MYYQMVVKPMSTRIENKYSHVSTFQNQFIP